MGDRVAIIGGTTSGRDHFPFPVQDSVGGVGVDLATAMLWFHRVKSWNLSGLVTIDATVDVERERAPDGQSHTLTTTAVFDISIPLAGVYMEPPTFASIPFTREADLVRDFIQWENSEPPDTPTGMWQEDDEQRGDVTGGVGQGLILLARGAGLGPLTYSGGLFYPDIELDIIFGFGPPSGYTFEGDEIRISSGDPTGDTGASFTIDGNSVPVWVTYTSANVTSWTASLYVNPDEYWPYAGNDGLPIYDTTTGALLPGRDPLS